MRLAEPWFGTGRCVAGDSWFASVLTASDDRTAKVWNVDTGECMKTLEGHDGRVMSAVFSADGSLVLTASEDGTCGVWDGRVHSAALKVAPQQSGPQRPSVCCADFLSHDRPLVVMALSDSSLVDSVQALPPTHNQGPYDTRH